MRRWFQNPVWAAAALGALTALTRLPFQSQTLYHWDSINLAFGVLRFDVMAEAPQFPGYILYVALAQVIHALTGDPQRALTLISVVSSALAVPTLYLLGRAMFSPAVGLTAALFLWGSPLVWFYGEVALPHALDLLLVIAAAGLLYRLRAGHTRWLWWTAVFLALVGGVRQQTLVFLLPLALWAIWRIGWGRLLLFGALVALTSLTWFLPLIAFSGGLGQYLAGSGAYSARFFNATSVLAGAGWPGLRRNLIKLLPYTLYGWGLAALPALGGLLRLRPLRLDDRAWFLALWCAPALGFYSLIHMGQQGLVFVFLPALLLASAQALHVGLRSHPQLLWPATLSITLGGAALFLLFPTYPLGESGPKLVTYDTIRAQDEWMLGRMRAIREQFDPRTTLLLASNWRYVQYYLPEYTWARFGIGAKWEADAGLPGDVDYVGQAVPAAQLGLNDSAGWRVVIFDDDLRAFAAAPAQHATAADGAALAYLALQPGEQYWTDGSMFGVKPAP